MLLGENGAGKSTLLRLIAGLLAPSRGTLEVLGGTPLSMRGRIAYMSHAPMLYDELTGVENLQYFASLERTSGSCTVCTGSVHAALQAVGLDPKLERTVGQYSQGMRQRVSLARALQTDPDLLLLDEPFSNLDVASTQQMIDLLAGFRTWAPSNAGAEPGRQVAARTLLLTTHQAHLAESLADTIVTMRGGTIMAVERRA
jgi:ABC-type multidrug transport system ATPase subunit